MWSDAVLKSLSLSLSLSMGQSLGLPKGAGMEIAGLDDLCVGDVSTWGLSRAGHQAC